MPWDKAFTRQALQQLFNNSMLILKISSLFSVTEESFRGIAKIHLIPFIERCYTGDPSTLL